METINNCPDRTLMVQKEYLEYIQKTLQPGQNGSVGWMVAALILNQSRAHAKVEGLIPGGGMYGYTEGRQPIHVSLSLIMSSDEYLKKKECIEISFNIQIYKIIA